MTRKDYVKIAEDIRTALFDTACGKDIALAQSEAFAALAECITDNIAGTMADDNLRFDRARFLKACGV